MNFTDEEHREHLLNLLKRLYRELVVYRAFVEFVKMAIGQNIDVEEILERARHDPELGPQVEAFFQDFSGATVEGLNNDLDRALRAYLLQWKPKGPPN